MDIVDVPATPCQPCGLAEGAVLTLASPARAVEPTLPCTGCKQEAQFVGIWRDDKGKDHAHYVCLGTLGEEAEGQIQRTHHHFDKPFRGSNP